MARNTPHPRTADDDSAIQGKNWTLKVLQKLFARVTPRCRQVIRMISESLDRPMSLRERVQLRAHYLICCYCRRYDGQMHRIRQFTRALPEHLDEAMQMRLSEDVKAEMKRRLGEPR